MSNKQCFNSRFCVSPLLSNYLIKRFVIPKVCLLINKLIHTCSASVGISHKFEINIATISKHNTKGLDFRISDMILQGTLWPPPSWGNGLQISINLHHSSHQSRAPHPFTVAVSKTRRPFSYNFEVFIDKSAKYWEILPSKITFETTDQAQSAQSIIYWLLAPKSWLKIMKNGDDFCWSRLYMYSPPWCH